MEEQLTVDIWTLIYFMSGIFVAIALGYFLNL